MKIDQCEIDRSNNEYYASLDIHSRNRMIKALQRVLVNSEKRLDILLESLSKANLKQWKLAMQMKSSMLDKLSDTQLEFILARPREPDCMRFRHARLCKKFGINDKVKGLGFNRVEHMRWRYLQAEGKEKPRARIVELANRIQKQIDTQVIPRESSRYVAWIVGELREISDLHKKQKK